MKLFFHSALWLELRLRMVFITHDGPYYFQQYYQRVSLNTWRFDDAAVRRAIARHVSGRRGWLTFGADRKSLFFSLNVLFTAIIGTVRRTAADICKSKSESMLTQRNTAVSDSASYVLKTGYHSYGIGYWCWIDRCCSWVITFRRSTGIDLTHKSPAAWLTVCALGGPMRGCASQRTLNYNCRLPHDMKTVKMTHIGKTKTKSKIEMMSVCIRRTCKVSMGYIMLCELEDSFRKVFV